MHAPREKGRISERLSVEHGRCHGVGDAPRPGIAPVGGVFAARAALTPVVASAQRSVISEGALRCRAPTTRRSGGERAGDCGQGGVFHKIWELTAVNTRFPHISQPAGSEWVENALSYCRFLQERVRRHQIVVKVFVQPEVRLHQEARQCQADAAACQSGARRPL